MPVVHLICRRPALPAQGPPPPTLDVRSACADRDGDLIAGLAAALAAAGPTAPTMVPRAAGLLGELSSRPNRGVEAWLTWVGLPAREQPAGLVSLVRCHVDEHARHSIGWLLVDPQARRQGVGRALVAHACHRAWHTGADEVWVESRSDWVAALAFWEAVGFTRVPGPGLES